MRIRTALKKKNVSEQTKTFFVFVLSGGFTLIKNAAADQKILHGVLSDAAALSLMLQLSL
jgi:hypothetical protein